MCDTITTVQAQTLPKVIGVTKPQRKQAIAGSKPPGVTGFPVQQQFQSVAHLELAATGFYEQYLTCWYPSLFPNGCLHNLGQQCLVGKCSCAADRRVISSRMGSSHPGDSHSVEKEKREGLGCDQHADILWCLS